MAQKRKKKAARKTAKRSVKRRTTRRRTAKRKTTKRTAKRRTAKRKTTRRKPASKTAKRKTTKRKATRRKTAKRRTTRRKPARKTAKRKTTRRKPTKRRVTRRKPARKTAKRRTPKRKVRRTAKRPAKRSAKRSVRKSPSVKRRKSAVKRRKPATRRFPSAPARAARVPRARFSFRKLASRLTPMVKPPIEAYRGNKPYVFASYSHKNMKEVFAVIKKLADARFRVWYDEGIEPGNEWPEEVGKALTGCQLFLVFMSPYAMESRNVRNEINFASSENKAVMVVNLQPVELSEGMKLQIGTVQFINKHEMADTDFIEKMKRVLDPVLRL
jgi:TIR domain